jgi:NAD(P)-dependent dehydrogenase (short-subunit alcohol dehydrogenase family)
MGMTLPMARDLGKYGIRVMTVAPGIFHTPMGDHIPTKAADLLKSSTPLGRVGEPIQFAQIVSAICENSFATGTVWRLDGGIRLPYL